MKIEIGRSIKERTVQFSLIPEDDKDVEILRQVKQNQEILEKLEEVKSWLRGKCNTDKTLQEFKCKVLEVLGLSHLLSEPCDFNKI